MKKHWHIWVGIGALLLAVLTVLGVVFLPRMAAKSDAEELLLLAAAPGAQYVMLVDPTFEHEGLMAGEGREIRLEGALLESTRAALADFAEDFSYEKKVSAAGGSLALHLLVKSAEGKIVKLYLTADTFYAVLKGSAYHFTADGYAALYGALQGAFS